MSLVKLSVHDGIRKLPLWSGKMVPCNAMRWMIKKIIIIHIYTIVKNTAPNPEHSQTLDHFDDHVITCQYTKSIFALLY